MSKTRPFRSNKCPNCGEYGSHYCGPSFGEEGFFICEEKLANNLVICQHCKKKGVNPFTKICLPCKLAEKLNGNHKTFLHSGTDPKG